MIQIIHTGDFHLDSPFSGKAAGDPEARRERLRGVVSALSAYIQRQGADIVLLAGDIFDSAYVSPRTAAAVISLFTASPNTRFFVSPGNHDPYTPSSFWARSDLPGNLHVFSSETPERVRLSCGADVWGYGFTGPRLDRFPFSGRPAELDPGRLNLLCAHGDIYDPQSPYCPISRRMLAETGFDYIALGHIHLGTAPERAGGGYFAYSGCPEGRSFDECGEKYALVLQAETTGVFSPRFSRVRLSPVRYERLTLDLSGAADDAEIYDKAVRFLSDYDRNSYLRLTLTGNVSPACDVTCAALGSLAVSLGGLELDPRLLPLESSSALMEDVSLRGELYRALRPRLESPDERERRVAAAALKLAFGALDG